MQQLEHGLQVFTVPLLHLRMTFLVGPSVSTHFYNAHDSYMSQKEVYGYSVPTFGDDVVFAVDEKVRAEQFQMLANALKSSKMASYVPVFVKEAEAFFGKWSSSGIIDFKDQFNELILFTASSTIMGREVRENVFKEVTHLYEELDKGVLKSHLHISFLHTSLSICTFVSRADLYVGRRPEVVVCTSDSL
jgi:sterol 14alpha-demethylase